MPRGRFVGTGHFRAQLPTLPCPGLCLVVTRRQWVVPGNIATEDPSPSTGRPKKRCLKQQKGPLSLPADARGRRRLSHSGFSGSALSVCSDLSRWDSEKRIPLWDQHQALGLLPTPHPPPPPGYITFLSWGHELGIPKFTV